MPIKHSELLGQEITSKAELQTLPKEIRDRSLVYEVRRALRRNADFAELDPSQITRIEIAACFTCGKPFVSAGERSCQGYHASTLGKTPAEDGRKIEGLRSKPKPAPYSEINHY
jgi:hypothetical protein